MINNNKYDKNDIMKVSLPRYARLPINRCNLPAIILGGLYFQESPRTLLLDGVHELHKNLFTQLKNMLNPLQRAEYFMDYMTVQFRMHKLDEVGLGKSDNNKRINADYLRMLRGWLFDADSREAAVLKSWVESRFGLLTLYHKGSLTDYNSETYARYLHERSRGIYATNAIEAQIDLLYSYCQYELAQQYNKNQRLTLFRGVNRVDNYEILQGDNRQTSTVLLNNLNSFTFNRDRADEFGDYIMQLEAPWQKILFYSNLLPGLLSGENEVLLIGGVYQVTITI